MSKLAEKDKVIFQLMEMLIPQTSEMPDSGKIQNLYESFKTLHQKET
jgi:hypothetical protein